MIRRIFKEIDPTLMRDVEGRLSLSEIIGRHVPLENMGNEHWRGLCPFCREGQLEIFEGFKTIGAFYHCCPHRADMPKPDAETMKAIRETPSLMDWYVKANTQPPTSRFCGAHGGCVGFTMRIENIGFREALQNLCDLADIPFIERDVERSVPDEAEIMAGLPDMEKLRCGASYVDLTPDVIAARAASSFKRMMAMSKAPADV